MSRAGISRNRTVEAGIANSLEKVWAKSVKLHCREALQMVQRKQKRLSVSGEAFRESAVAGLAFLAPELLRADQDAHAHQDVGGWLGYNDWRVRRNIKVVHA